LTTLLMTIMPPHSRRSISSDYAFLETARMLAWNTRRGLIFQPRDLASSDMNTDCASRGADGASRGCFTRSRGSSSCRSCGCTPRAGLGRRAQPRARSGDHRYAPQGPLGRVLPRAGHQTPCAVHDRQRDAAAAGGPPTRSAWRLSGQARRVRSRRDRDHEGDPAPGRPRRDVSRGDTIAAADALGAPHRGAARLALEPGATLIPAAITGTGRLRRGPILLARHVQVAFAEPIRVAAHDMSQTTRGCWSEPPDPRMLPMPHGASACSGCLDRRDDLALAVLGADGAPWRWLTQRSSRRQARRAEILPAVPAEPSVPGASIRPARA
jgi:hypothetical protein